MPTQARIGRRIAAYRIEELIGRGGMGVVYRAEHAHLRRTVALKLLAPELAENERFRERFIRESRVAASIPHQNIVTVYDAGEVEGVLYIAMQYVEGTDLATLLRERRTLEPSEALWVLRQAGSALDSAHERGLVHRDVKPGNVLLDSQRAYLSDFGLTKPSTARTPWTMPGQLVGTINYVAPEQIRGDPVDGRADVYALGCVLYECLAGEIPYPRDSEIAALYAHLHDAPPRLSEKRKDMLADCDDAIARALAKSPDERFRTCGQMLDAVQGALRVETPPLHDAPTLPGSPAPSAPTRVRRSLTSALTRLPTAHVFSTRRPARTAALIALLAAGVAGGVLAFALSGGGKQAPRVATSGPSPSPSPQVTPVAVTTVPVGAEPTGIAIGVGGVWVASAGTGTLTRIDPVIGRPTGAPVPVGANPVAVAERSHTVFVANGGNNTVSRIGGISATPVGPPVALGREPRAMSVGIGDGAMWVAAADGTVTRFNAQTGAIVGTPIAVGRPLRGIATGQDEAWVTGADGTVTRIDAKKGRAAGKPIRVGARPRGIAIGYGKVWVANTGSDTVTRISIRTGRQIGQPTRVGHAPAAIAIGQGLVWVANSADGTVTRLLPSSGRTIGRPIHVGHEPLGIRIGAGSVWVANRGSGTVARIQPRSARPPQR